MAQRWPFTVNGPTSQPVRFRAGNSRTWGLGLRPAGWAKFVDMPADRLSNTLVNGETHPSFADFAPLLALIRGANGDTDKAARNMDAYLLGMADREVPCEPQILACQEILRDPEVSDVAELGERLDIAPRTLVRLCRRYFGFPPKLLLRRQRFLRSLAQFMRDPSLTWVSALDGQYYDQAQFVRDFRSFMGLTPSQYAAMEHPILEPVMQQRLADHGVVPRIDLPTIMRYHAEAPQPG